jgi:hypothetical protein
VLFLLLFSRAHFLGLGFLLKLFLLLFLVGFYFKLGLGFSDSIKMLFYDGELLEEFIHGKGNEP